MKNKIFSLLKAIGDLFVYILLLLLLFESKLNPLATQSIFGWIILIGLSLGTLSTFVFLLNRLGGNRNV
jgi:hypothetical protein